MADKGRIRFSRHAIQRMTERGVTRTEVLDAIKNGEELDIQILEEEGKDVRVLFQENTKCKPNFYVVVGCCLPSVAVITVCETEGEVWEYLGTRIIRR